jgi:YVTN family beta-propeller protein
MSTPSVRRLALLLPFAAPLAACSRGVAVSSGGASSSPTGTVVVANMGDNTATILDVASRRALATVPTGAGPHEVAVSHDGRWAIVSNYGVRGAPGNSLTVIDLSTLAVQRTISLGTYQRPHGMAFLPGDSLLAVTSEVSGKVLFVDLRRDSVTSTIATNGRASHMLAMTADGSRIFTSNVASGNITEQDVPRREAARTIAVAPAVEGIGVTPDGAFVWVGSNERKTLSVVDTKRGVVADTIGGFGMPYRIAITPDGRTAVVPDPPKSEVRIYDATTHALRATVTIGAEGVLESAEFKGSASPEGIVLSRDGRTAFVALQGVNRIAIIDVPAGRLAGTMPAGAGPDGIGYSPRTR